MKGHDSYVVVRTYAAEGGSADVFAAPFFSRSAADAFVCEDRSKFEKLYAKCKRRVLPEGRGLDVAYPGDKDLIRIRWKVVKMEDAR